MATIKRITDLRPYASVLPYASEMFGIYQPLLGWKSKRIQKRFREGYENDRQLALEKLTRQFVGLVEVRRRDDNELDIQIREGALTTGALRTYKSVVLEKLAAALPPHGQLEPAVWPQVITRDRVDHILKTDVVKAYSTAHAELARAGGLRIERREPSREGPPNDSSTAVIERQLRYESAVAGAVLLLAQNKAHAALEEVFYATHDQAEQAQALMRVLHQDDPASGYLDLSTMDPQDLDHIQSVVLSPIAVVHLFRQYFFELDTFLGTPEKHVWLSPGSSVELIEVHTRRTVVEKTLETALEIMTATERTMTQQEEISEAVKEENQQDTKFGASVTASYASVSATSSFDYASSQREARETTHQRTRQQTDKLSSQIRRNFKSTFKTTTEVTDVSSTRHLLSNTTDSLINYELRRKMRQVGVQVQDIGTFLCWQCYVDDPGRELGLAKLIHIAKPAELGSIPHPEEIPTLQPFADPREITIPFISVDGTGADSEGEVYVNGVEADQDEFLGSEERIQARHRFEFVCPKADHELTSVEFDPAGQPLMVSMSGKIERIATGAYFDLNLDSVDFQGKNSITCKVILHWSPKKEANEAIEQKNRQNLAVYQARERAEYERAYVESVKDRVTMASKIARRPSDELREEERIVVYRRLIQEMLMKDVPLPDDRTRHVVAEVISSMFDVDKMLYFVAPEWWRPRLHRSRQQLPEQPPAPATGGLTAVLDDVVRRALRTWTHGGSAPQTSPMASSTVGWGGVEDPNRDSYFITDGSEPARFGSSLGWLLQLDGDNMRNAFLNAPWVKAVIPIRPGRELEAINWLKGVEGMNGITDDVVYRASNPNERDLNGDPTDGQPMLQVLKNLAMKIRKKHEEGLATGTYPNAGDVSDPTLVDDENTVTSTPIDRVYEHGFYPLKDGFRANVGADYEIFDQWTEVLPTDQIVPVPVTYDPKTGRQI
ncbi:MAG TPA: hypothetical protein VFP58_02050 [Candidatus Eisenbacteria bacterium]|nr:hypothetical protein [Candidatus Eisenbacteria bacterium]